MTYAVEGTTWPTPTVTWSFASLNYPQDTAAGVTVSDAVSDPAVQAVVERAFAAWSSVSALQFTQVADTPTKANSADIRVGFGVFTSSGEIGETDWDSQFRYSGSAYGDYFQPGVVVRLGDPAVEAVASVGGALTYTDYDVTLYQVALHEVGHSLGLAHDQDNPSAIMYPVATTANQKLSGDDIAGIQSLYGDATLTLSGNHTQYAISTQQDGSVLVQDLVAGRDGTTDISKTTTLVFADGAGVADTDGVAEDVDRIYEAAFNRAGDASGEQYWAASINVGAATLASVAENFTQSPEFIAATGGLSGTAYVQKLYQDILGRAGDAGGVNYWSGALSSGAADRGGVLAGFAASAEDVLHTQANDGSTDGAEVTRLYQAAFGRAADASGQQFWINALASGSTPLQVAQDFTASAEFASAYASLANPAFVGQLYQNVLHRAGDAGGVQFWDGQLAGGASRAAVLLGLADSNENRVGTAGVTHDGWAFLA